MRLAVGLLTITCICSQATVASADTAAVKAACEADKSPRLKAIHERGVLNWAVGIAAPFAAKDAKGEYVGTEPENAKEFADILGVKLEIRDYSYDLLPPTIATGNADIVGAALYITDKRKQVIDMSCMDLGTPARIPNVGSVFNPSREVSHSSRNPCGGWASMPELASHPMEDSPRSRRASVNPERIGCSTARRANGVRF